ARSILNGNGYREAWLASNQPVTHFPPMFSSVLALVGLTGLDPLRGTRFVNSLLFGGNIFLLGVIGWKMTKSQMAGIALAILFLVNHSLFRLHTAAMSEPLYIFLTLASFLTFYYYFQLKQKRWLIITGCLVGLAYLTRYAGLALFATFLVSLILLKNPWRHRFSRSLIFIASFILFALGWSIRNRLLADSATNRTIVYHPITQENIQMGIYNFSLFFMPFEAWRRELMRIPNLFSVIIFIILLILLTWLLYKGLKKFFQPSTETPEILSFISTLYIFGYLVSIISSMTWFDASTKFQLRILSPIFVSILIINVYFINWLWQKQKPLATFYFILIFSLSLYGVSAAITELRKGGQGYASFQWFDAEAMKFLRNLPEDTKIYTNEAPAV
ncbi:MAG: ArnT family glycosyltransferase, partial [Anaerolineales bacterium]